VSFNARAFNPKRPPALVLGGLNLLRAVGLAGIPAVVASPKHDWPAFVSRYARGALVLPPLDDPAAVTDVLVRAGRRLRDSVGCRLPLYYGNDDYLSLIQSNHEALEPYFAMILNEPEVARALIDKDRFEGFARRLGLPVPRTIAWEELEGWTGPVLAKPKHKLRYHSSTIYQRLFGGAGKARVFPNGAAAAALPLLRQLREELLFQEYVQGDDRALWSFHGYADENGELLAWFVGHKLRTHPALTGASTFLELAHDEDCARVGREIAARIPLRGVFKIDLKHDAASGAWTLLEVNARSNLWHHLGARNGISLPRVAYDYLLQGKRPGPLSYRTKYRWVAMRGDFRAFRELRKRGELSAAGWLRSLGEAPLVHDVFAWTDPAPFLRHSAQQVKLRLPRLGARMLRWLYTAS
jgi:predicted ATP-grasp superfamily ATP-dependent carboligase